MWEKEIEELLLMLTMDERDVRGGVDSGKLRMRQKRVKQEGGMMFH